MERNINYIVTQYVAYAVVHVDSWTDGLMDKYSYMLQKQKFHKTILTTLTTCIQVFPTKSNLMYSILFFKEC